MMNNTVSAVDDDDYEFSILKYMTDLGNQNPSFSSDHDTVSCVPSNKPYVPTLNCIPKRKRTTRKLILEVEVEKKELKRECDYMSEINPSLDDSIQEKLKRRKAVKNKSNSTLDYHPFLLASPHLKPERTPKKRTTQKKKMTYFLPTALPDLRKEYREKINRMGGTDVHLLIQRELIDTDVRGFHGCLSIPASQLMYHETKWLTDKERLGMRTKISGRCYAFVVPLIDKDLDTADISIKRWNMAKGSATNNPMYNLIVERFGCEE